MALMDGTAGTTSAPPPLMTEAAATAAAAAASHATEPTAGADAAGEGDASGAGNGEEDGQPPKEEQQELSREVEAALLLMEGHEADEAKFAGLLLLVKHLQQSQAQQQGDPLAAGDARARLLAAMGPHFLARLLATTTPSPIPPQQEPQQQSSMPGFAPLALAVLRTLAQDPSLLPRLRLPALLAPLVARLERDGPPPEPAGDEAEEGLKEDCLSLLYAFAAHDSGAVPVLAKAGAGRGVVRCLVTAAAAAAGAREEKETEGTEKGEAEAHFPPLVRQTCAALEALVAAEGRALSSAAAAAAAATASTKGSNKPPSSLVLLLDGPSLAALTSLLATERRPALRLALLPLLATTLAQRRGVAAALPSFHQRDKKTEGPLPASFPASLRAALLPWLHGSVREAPRDQALALAVHALGLWGQTWVVEDKDEVGGDQDKPEEGGGGDASSSTVPKQRRMARGGTAGVLVSALAAEACMLADELEGLVAALHDPELRADANLQRRLERARRLLPVCLDGLDSVMRFLCGAGDGECPLPALLEPDPAWSPEDKAWVSLPSPVLLGMRSAIHGAVAGVLKMLQDAGSDLLPPPTNPPGPDDHTGPQQQPSLLLRLLPVYRESARFLSAVLAEDPHCLSPAEALATLPVVRALVGHADHDDESDAATESRLPPHLPLPWVARALDIDLDDATGTAEAAAAVDGLVDQGIHLWLLDQLALPVAHPAAWPLTPRLDGLALLHAMLAGGGAAVPCVDHSCSLARHPKLVALLPHLASTVGNPQAPARLRLHAAWFLLAAVVGKEEDGGEGEKGEGGAWCGADDAAVALLTREAVVEGLADVAVVGRRAGWGEAAPAEAEEDEEDRGLWARLLAMVASSAAASDGLELAARVPAAAEARYGRKEGEAVRELLLEVMAGQEAEAAVRGWRR